MTEKKIDTSKLALTEHESVRVAKIRKLFRELENCVRVSVQKALEIGALLHEQKMAMGHGKFEPWLKKHVSFITPRTARRWMHLHLHRDEIDLSKISKLSEAYRLLEESNDEEQQPDRIVSVQTVPADDTPIVVQVQVEDEPQASLLIPATVETPAGKEPSTEPPPEAQDEPGDLESSAAMQCAETVIDQLKKIGKKDPYREAALYEVSEWISSGGRKASYQSRAARLQAALNTIDGAITDIEELRDEITNWKEGMEGTNLENSAKYTELEECADALDTLIEEIRSAAGNGGDIEFPGMY